MTIGAILGNCNQAVTDYFKSGVHCVGSAAEKAKELRNNLDFFQKICILHLAGINWSNAIRGTNLMGRLAHVLDATYVSDFPSIIKDINVWFKPINANSIREDELLEIITSAYHTHYLAVNDKQYNGKREFLRLYLKPILAQFKSDLFDKNKGSQFGYATSKEFLLHLGRYIDIQLQIDENAANEEQTVESDLYKDSAIGFDLAKAVKNVPLKSSSWSAKIATHVFHVVDVMTPLVYFKEWGLVDTAKWATTIGQKTGVGVFNRLDLFTVFKSTILVGYTALLVDAANRIRQAADPADKSLGPNAKHNVRWNAVTAATESIFYGISVLSVFEVITRNPALIALSLIAAKLTGSLGIVMHKDESLDASIVSVKKDTKKSLVSRASRKVSALLKPITKQRHVKFATRKVSQLVAKVTAAVGAVFEYLSKLIDQDGFDKLYKSIIPKLSIVDKLRVRDGKSELFTEWRATLNWHKDALYATKIFNSIPNWIVKNPEKTRLAGVEVYELRTPLHQWNKATNAYELKLKVPSGWSTALLDISTIFETTKFLRKYEVYPFEYFVGIGQKIYESHIPLFGTSVKNVPVLSQIYSTPKNIFVFAATIIDVGTQLHSKFIAKKQDAFNWENSFKFAGNIGKLAIICLDAPSKLSFDIIASLTGDAGLIKFWIAQNKAKKKFNNPGALATAA